jgi:hypothetical protein
MSYVTLDHPSTKVDPATLRTAQRAELIHPQCTIRVPELTATESAYRPFAPEAKEHSYVIGSASAQVGLSA